MILPVHLFLQELLWGGARLWVGSGMWRPEVHKKRRLLPENTEKLPKTIILTSTLHGSAAYGLEEGKWHLWFSSSEMLDLPSFMLQQAQCGARANKQSRKCSRGMLTEETFVCSLHANYKTPSLLQAVL